MAVEAAHAVIDGPGSARRPVLCEQVGLLCLGAGCNTTVNQLDGTRAAQILDFVTHQAHACPAWVVLDDDDITHGLDGMLMAAVRERFVRTNGKIGLQDADVEKAMQILKQQADD
eukprot:365776-Chlamydomonas_euryale.AAC.2